MKPKINRTLIYLVIACLPVSAVAQKVSLGYDKGTDFKKFTSYTWAQPEMPPTRPLLYEMIVGTVDYELKAKGLSRTETNGDLTVIPAGGMEFGLNMPAGTPILGTRGGVPVVVDATMWTGAGGGSSVLMAPSVSEGSLVLTFVDRGANKAIWTGTVSQKLDMQDKKKSLELIDKAITKLLKQFPPSKK